MLEFSSGHNCNALYQGPTLVGPFRPNKDLGFSPCDLFFTTQAQPVAKQAAEKGRTEGEDRTLSG
jgi:hypothetical protein